VQDSVFCGKSRQDRWSPVKLSRKMRIETRVWLFQNNARLDRFICFLWLPQCGCCQRIRFGIRQSRPVLRPVSEEMTAWDVLQRHCCLDADIALRCCSWSKDHHSDHIIIEIDNSAGTLPDRPSERPGKLVETRLNSGNPSMNSLWDDRSSRTAW
jgi:hypothetical protein